MGPALANVSGKPNDSDVGRKIAVSNQSRTTDDSDSDSDNTKKSKVLKSPHNDNSTTTGEQFN
jgi:hypothetical protein